MNHLLICLFFLSSLSFSVTTQNRFFPPNFKFGVGTSAYQIEGAWNTDGKGENIWDHACHTYPDYIQNGATGDITCDSYHRYKEDVAMLKQLGVDFYRFSLSWSRILPRGVSESSINQLGVDYYRNLLQELINNDIEPFVTIYHFDLPQPLQEIGGWLNPKLIEHYVYFARIVFEKLGDLVKYWIPFNEPLHVCSGGYGEGTIPPGLNASGVADYLCAHVIIKAHARAYHMYHTEYKNEEKGFVGIALNGNWYEPASNSVEDKKAAERMLQFTYGWFANPIVFGNYPQVMIDRIGEKSKEQGYMKSRLPEFTLEEINYTKGTHDFLALNTYTTFYTRWLEESNSTVVGYESDLNVQLFDDPSWEETALSIFKVVPKGIRKMVNWISKTYKNPEIFITENGFSDKGGLDDERRINYYREYLSNLLDAIWIDGINISRYTAWTLMDNLEWREGFSVKFGLYSVDFQDSNLTRTPKASATYYSKIIASRCLVDQCEEE